MIESPRRAGTSDREMASTSFAGHPTGLRDRLALRRIVDACGGEADARAVGSVKVTGVFPLFIDESVFLADCILSNPEWFRGKIVRDMGSGTGILSFAAKAAGAKVVLGLDISPQAIMSSRQAGRRLGMTENVTFELGDWAALMPFQLSDVLVVNPPFAPAPLGGHLPKTSFGGYLGVTEIAHVLNVAANAQNLVLLSLSLQGRERGCLVTEIIRMRRPNARITSVPLYGETLPVRELASVMGSAYDIQEWTEHLAVKGFDSLDYRLFVASDVFTATELSQRSLDLLVAPSKYSGSWQGRLNRYRAWQG